MAFWKRRKQGGTLDPGRFDGKRLRYVTERDTATATESVVGRQGLLSITEDGRVSIICDGSIVFRGRLERCNIAELMSLEGAVLKGFDEDNQKERTLVAYYHYHRKIQ